MKCSRKTRVAEKKNVWINRMIRLNFNNIQKTARVYWRVPVLFAFVLLCCFVKRYVLIFCNPSFFRIIGNYKSCPNPLKGEFLFDSCDSFSYKTFQDFEVQTSAYTTDHTYTVNMKLVGFKQELKVLSHRGQVAHNWEIFLTRTQDNVDPTMSTLLRTCNLASFIYLLLFIFFRAR